MSGFDSIRHARWSVRMTAALFVAALWNAYPLSAQVVHDWRPVSQINRGTTIAVRTTEPITASSADGRIYPGVVDEDVIGRDGQVAIPRGSTAELIVRHERDRELAVDLDSVTINGERYAISADATPVGTSGPPGNLGANRETAEHVGGGALLGTIIGAIAGGGKGAAIGAGVGAAAGAGLQVVTHGDRVNVPAEALLTFQLDRPMTVGVSDPGYDRDGRHYHPYDNGPYEDRVR
jgi:hypothetical protein